MVKIHTNKINLEALLDSNNTESRMRSQVPSPMDGGWISAAVVSRLSSLGRRPARILYNFARPFMRPIAHRLRRFLMSDFQAELTRITRTINTHSIETIRRDQLTILRDLQEIKSIVSRLETHARTASSDT